jgi:hypothetical protein
MNNEYINEDEDDYLFEDDDWEVSEFPENIKQQYPGYYCLKITNFNSSTLSDILEWCKSNMTRGEWKRVGWNSDCSYSVGIVAENNIDASLFKLRWG